MLRMIRTLLLVGACVALPFVTGTAPATPEELNAGKEWLAWTLDQRNVYVYGFIEGYWKGSQTACKLADDLFEVGKHHRVGEGPRARCENALEQYTKIKTTDSGVDFSAYTTIVTEFYTKHPEYQNVSMGYLLFSLSDRNDQSADHLYQVVKREWGSMQVDQP
jgi:hypothetical protein